MYRFLESIKLLNGQFYRLELHQKRMNQVHSRFYPDTACVDLKASLQESVYPPSGLFKCRLIFSDIIHKIEFQPYYRKEISSLKLVNSSIPSLNYKSEDRALLDFAFEKRENCDDILIAVDGLIKDTWYCNVALYNGKRWISPSNPLIFGVNRADLLNKGLIEEKDIPVNTLKNYSKIRLFNAMIEFGEIELDISNIIF